MGGHSGPDIGLHRMPHRIAVKGNIRAGVSMADHIPHAGRREAPAGGCVGDGMAYRSGTGVPAGRGVWGTNLRLQLLSL